MAHVGGYFHPAQQQHARRTRHLARLAEIPHRVVLGDTYSADPDRASALDQVVRGEVGIRTAAVRMQVEIYGEPALPLMNLGDDAHAAVTIERASEALFRKLRGQRDLLDMVADADLVHHVHPFDHAAKNGVLAVKTRLRFEADIELAAARLAFRIHLIAEPRGRNRASEMLFGGADFSGQVVAGAAASVTFGIAALNDNPGDNAMKRQAVVKALFAEGFKIRRGLGRDARVQLDH